MFAKKVENSENKHLDNHNRNEEQHIFVTTQTQHMKQIPGQNSLSVKKYCLPITDIHINIYIYIHIYTYATRNIVGSDQ